MRLATRTIVVAHPESMVAEGIAAALARQPGIVPLAAVTTAEEAERVGREADAVALDDRLANVGAVASKLRRQGVRVVMLSVAPRGSLDAPAEQGIAVSTRDSVAHLARALAPETQRARSGRSVLTERQTQVLSLIAEGLAGKQVARHLGISEKTVERHKTRIFARLKVPNQTAAVSLALRHELAGSPPWNRSSI